MKNLYLICFILSSLVLQGCIERKKSEIKKEQAKVVAKTYVPEINGRISGGVGFTTSGDLTYNFGKSYHQPEVFATVVVCNDHNMTFTLFGKELFGQVEVGQIITLNYVEILERKEGEEWRVIDYQTISFEVPKGNK